MQPHYIFASKQAGGLAYIDPVRENHVQTIVQAVKMLNSDDPTVSTVAKYELRQTVRFATQSDPNPSLVSSFLSNIPDRRLDTIRSHTGSLWTRTRQATKSIKVTITVPDIGHPSLSAPDYPDPVAPKDVCRFLHNVERDQAAQHLRDLRDQGKVPRALSADKYANGSKWLFTGLNIRFKDWRFIHRARLNCLPTNSVKSRWSDCSPTCRHCEEDETLPHLLCHCPTNMPAITTHHNKIVDHLTNAVRSGSISTDKTVQDSGSPVRPDIVITDVNHVTIIDVCCPFENGPESLEEAVARKEVKYNLLNLPNPTCHSCQSVILWEVDPIFCSYCDSYYHTLCVSCDQATSGEFLDWICDECFSSSDCSFNSSTGNTTFESDLTSETTSEDHDVISNRQVSNNFSYLKLHLPNKGLRFGQWNVNHLTSSKFEQIKLLLTTNSDCIDILFLTETFLKPSSCDSLYNIPGFTLLRKDRLHKAGGGVAVYCSNALTFNSFSSTAEITRAKPT